DGSISNDVLNLIGVVHMAEYITDEHFYTQNKEWPQFERDVLKHFEMTTTELAELKGDILAELNGE
ncbi:MAG: hypothetical protein Q8O24_04950, partial [Gallionellaceae bacterium]|nr:hypothetical protein [Gallionellaceae bacterium]